ncbi:hypothetical protein CBR_g39806 [Chara braunii]|uniref:SMC hinge domain-containing protein n=1 Tax=Chara braunii TaxID=69332 RepID=A0A388LSB5_CHABU|nr:hypothetical protein CBR_g39806 [Chara braunii]|eukprot:GBG85240.1 hypothetical protein CBR_g39806 [Chara braunii]
MWASVLYYLFEEQWIGPKSGSLEETRISPSVLGLLCGFWSEAKIAAMEEEMRQLNESCMDQSVEIDEKKNALEELEQKLEECKAAHTQLKQQRDEMTNKRKELWRSDSGMDATVEKLKEEIKKFERHLEYAIPRDINRGITSVKRICRDHNIPGVAGALIELLDCDDKFNTAVEVTAGNSLFHVVVESDDISTRIIRYLNAEKGGRVTFMPLNQLRPHRVQYPASPDVVPILHKLKFNRVYANAFAQVFSKTLICRDLEVATNMARQSEMDCVTLEGDQVNRRGALTGGYHDSRRSRLSAMKGIKANAAKIEQLNQEGIAMKAEIEKLDQSISQVLAELQKQEARMTHMCSQREQLKQELKAAKDKDATNKKALAQKEKMISATAKGLQDLQERVASLQAELGTDLSSDLSPAEQKLLSQLNPEIRQLKQELINCKTKRMEVETRKSELEELLSANLLKRQSELEQQLASMDTETRTLESEAKQKALDEARAHVEEIGRKQKEISDQLAQLVGKMRELKAKKDELKALEDKYERTLQDEAKDMEQLLNKRNVLFLKKEELMKKIRELGSLPSDAFENRLLTDRSYWSAAIRSAVGVGGRQKIRELIAVLDQRKDESIERTFKGVAKNFREAFAELVQGGHGQLVMIKKRKAEEAPDDDDDDDEPTEGEEAARVEKYVGVKVKVSFTGRGETQSMKQLSGGQKTVVALALIFAIQRCDPAPFYLFDEIDAALDPQYRTAVGNMIKRQTETTQTQFITTTFRPELVKVADRIYGVSHKNRVSRVDVIPQEEALRFIEADHSQNRP